MICSTLLSFKCQSSKNSSTTASNEILSSTKSEKNKLNNMDTTKIVKTDEEWKKNLTV